MRVWHNAMHTRVFKMIPDEINVILAISLTDKSPIHAIPEKNMYNNNNNNNIVAFSFPPNTATNQGFTLQSFSVIYILLHQRFI